MQTSHLCAIMLRVLEIYIEQLAPSNTDRK